MKIFKLSLASLVLLPLAFAPAMAAEKETYSSKVKVEQSDDGDYKKTMTEESVDASGAKISGKTEAKVDVDSNGDRKETTLRKTTRDPDGAMNKVTSETKKTVKTDAEGNFKSEMKSEGKNAAGGDVKVKSSKSVKLDSKGGAKTEVKTKKVTDPKGLLNKTTEESIDETVQHADGTVEKNYKRKLNGDTVEETHVDR